MNGVEVQVVSRSTELGIENPFDTNSGAIELWKDGKRILELTWWEKMHGSVETLREQLELHSHLTYNRGVHHSTSEIRG